MLKAIHNSRSGLYGHQYKLDIISNNISNANTNGYKKADIGFTDTFAESLNRLGVPLGDKGQEGTVGGGTRIAGTVFNRSQGDIRETCNIFDFAIVGDGYFKVTDGKQEYYTRNGNFRLDGNGNLVDINGYKLELNIEKDNIELSNIQINEQGQIIYGEEVIGKLNTYKIPSDDKLQNIGNNLYKYIPNSQEDKPEISNSKIKQGYIETSNVDIAKELVDLMTTQRAFAMNSKALQTSDEMWQKINELRK